MSCLIACQASAPADDAPPGPRTRGYAPRDRGAVQFGKQRLVVPQRIGFVGIGLRPQAPVFQEPRDTPANAVRDAGDFSITGRGNMPENQLVSPALNINAVQSEREDALFRPPRAPLAGRFARRGAPADSKTGSWDGSHNSAGRFLDESGFGARLLAPCETQIERQSDLSIL